MPDDDNPTATRMATEAAERHAETVQKIVDEVADSHAGAPPTQVKEALQDTWADELADSALPLPVDKADEYAEHISAGLDIVVVPAKGPLTSEFGE